ncbi:MAG: hypothetical protein O2894_12160 [Planctomycetota bacterium]|nr:hypothetical protein [Planctomycetota bacterium]
MHRFPTARRARRLACLALGAALLLGSARSAPGEPEGPPGVPDKALQAAIDRAIEKGAEFLRAQQKQNGLVGGVHHGSDRHYTIGTTALAGLALLAAGDRQGDPGVDKAIEYCRGEDRDRAGAGSRTTYDTGTLLMFVTEYYRSRTEKGKGGKKHTITKEEKENPCTLPPDVVAWIKDMAMFLVDTQEADGGFGYPKPREDMSNTQYALLGLRAARECGGVVPGRVFKRVIDRLLALQEPEGPKVLRTLGGTKKGDAIYKIDGGDRARGWSYMAGPFPATGSMTTAGIASLVICHDALTQPARLPMYDHKVENQVKRAVQDGFAWLDVNFTVERNPGMNAPPWHYYYLYGLERAAVFCDRGLIGSHDWYLLGARYLIAHQHGDGSWNTGNLGGKEYKPSAILDTAWAILFLKKATRPLKPLPAPVVTPPSK